MKRQLPTLVTAFVCLTSSTLARAWPFGLTDRDEHDYAADHSDAAADAAASDEALRSLPAQPGDGASPHGTPLLMYFDGKDSCRHLASGRAVAAGEMGTWSSGFAASVARVTARDAAAPDFLVSCLPLFGKPGAVDFYLVRSGAAFPLHGRLSVDDFIDYLGSLTAAATGPVHVAGHSYGGWLAMKVAASLPEGVAFTSLLTIDPISALTCQPLKGLADVIRLGAPVRCNEAPADIGDDVRAQVAAHTGHWRNVFETANAYLHSSVISAADENVELPFAPVSLLDGLRSEDNPHLFVAQAPETWAAFGAAP